MAIITFEVSDLIADGFRAAQDRRGQTFDEIAAPYIRDVLAGEGINLSDSPEIQAACLTIAQQRAAAAKAARETTTPTTTETFTA